MKPGNYRLQAKQALLGKGRTSDAEQMTWLVAASLLTALVLTQSRLAHQKGSHESDCLFFV